MNANFSLVIASKFERIGTLIKAQEVWVGGRGQRWYLEFSWAAVSVSIFFAVLEASRIFGIHDCLLSWFLLYRSLHIENSEVFNGACLARINHCDFKGESLKPSLKSQFRVVVGYLNLWPKCDCVSAVETQIFSRGNQNVRRSYLMDCKSWQVGYDDSLCVIAERRLAEEIGWTSNHRVSYYHRQIRYLLCSIVWSNYTLFDHNFEIVLSKKRCEILLWIVGWYFDFWA